MRNLPNVLPPFLSRSLRHLLTISTLVGTSLATGCSTAALGAGHFDVRPVRVELHRPGAIGVLELGNRGPEPVVIQAESRRWSQVDGQSLYHPDNSLLISPPIFTIEPGQRQVVRVGLRNPAPVETEETFRIFFSGIPGPESTGGRKSAGVDIALRLAVPVFVAPRESLEPPLEGSIRRRADDRLELVLSNPGNVHVQLRSLGCSSGNRPMAVGEVVGYVLAGTQRRFEVDPEGWAPMREPWNCDLRADTDRGVRETRLSGWPLPAVAEAPGS